jgi:hypothetical protein
VWLLSREKSGTAARVTSKPKVRLAFLSSQERRSWYRSKSGWWERGSTESSEANQEKFLRKLGQQFTHNML